jgi:hypothetical protein
MGACFLTPCIRYVVIAAAFAAIMYGADITNVLDGGSIAVEDPQMEVAAVSTVVAVQEEVGQEAAEQATGQTAADAAEDQRAKSAAKAARRKRLAKEQQRKQAEADARSAEVKADARRKADQAEREAEQRRKNDSDRLTGVAVSLLIALLVTWVVVKSTNRDASGRTVPNTSPGAKSTAVSTVPPPTLQPSRSAPAPTLPTPLAPAAKWIGSDGSVTVAGFRIPGFVYTGSNLPAIKGYDAEPSLIDPSKPVAPSTAGFDPASIPSPAASNRTSQSDPAARLPPCASHRSRTGARRSHRGRAVSPPSGRECSARAWRERRARRCS